MSLVLLLLSSNITQHDESRTKAEKSHKDLFQRKILLKQTTNLLLEAKKPFLFYCVRKNKKPNPGQNLRTIRDEINFSPEFRIKPFSEESFSLIMKEKMDQKLSVKFFLTNEN